MSTSTLTPAQKALVKAQLLQAELDCAALQAVRKSAAVQSARIRAHVAAVTRDDRIAARIADKLSLARAVNGLSESDRTLLTGKSASDTSEKVNPKRLRGNGVRKGEERKGEKQTDATVQ